MQTGKTKSDFLVLKSKYEHVHVDTNKRTLVFSVTKISIDIKN